MKKKYLVIVIAIILMFSLISCGNKEVKDSDSKSALSNEEQLNKQVNSNDNILNKANKQGSTNGNILNEGVSTSQGEWIYYFVQNGGESSPYGGYIHKEKFDGSERQEINIKGIDKASYINVIGEYIYFINNNEDPRLYKAKLDGEDLTKLSDDDIILPIVVGEWIYYINGSDNYRIYKMKVDGSNVKNVNNEETTAFNIIDDYLYYITENDEEGSICKIKNDGTDKKVIVDKYKPGIILNTIIVYNDYIYYTVALEYLTDFYTTGLYKCKEDGTDKRMVLEKLGAFNIKDNTIYYSLFKKGLFKCDLDGENIMKISADYTYSINLVENYIYYYVGGNSIIKMKLDGTSRERIYKNQRNDL